MTVSVEQTAWLISYRYRRHVRRDGVYRRYTHTEEITDYVFCDNPLQWMVNSKRRVAEIVDEGRDGEVDEIEFIYMAIRCTVSPELREQLENYW